MLIFEADDKTEKRSHERAFHVAEDRMWDIRNSIAALPASGINAAAVQMRVLSDCHSDSNGEPQRRTRLTYSILNALESQGGGARDQWAGDYYIPQNLDPFNYTSQGK